MNNKRIKHKRFIEKYEKNVKLYRKNYYKNIIKNNTSSKIKVPFISFYLIPLLIAIIILLVKEFTLTGYIISLGALIIANILIKLLSIALKLENKNKYLEEIKKQGFLTIEDYENKLKKYVTGPGGYYETLLNNLKTKYEINENTKKIYGINGEEYYIWTNNKQDKIYLLNSKTNEHPQISVIKMANIRYFREDKIKRTIILITDIEDYYFKPDSIDILNELLRNKRFENIQSFDPEEHINDFEIFMHNRKKQLSENNNNENEKLTNSINLLILFTIIIFLLYGLTYILTAYKTIIHIITIFFIILFNNSIRNIISYKKITTDDDWIKIINNDSECIERFNELKFALRIKDNYDKVYTKEGACYLTWVANGYFHVFLNLIYFNVVYMAIKTQDVTCYKTTNNTCEVKLKDKTLVFQKEAEHVFAKLLPNKDYNWLKEYQK